MPVIQSTYKAPYFFRNGFVTTVYSGLIRKVSGLDQKRERITLSDGDFLDLDWSYSEEKSKKLIIILHGLEGNAQRHYITGTAKYFNQNGIDAVSMNFRGCSGEDNLTFRSYHSGDTDDLKEVIQHILQTKSYTEIYLKGFSLGGNVTLKYLGETTDIPEQIKYGIAVSVPCYLAGSAKELHRLKNKAFHDKFKSNLKSKLLLKSQKYQGKIKESDIQAIKTLYDFDNLYTSKAHGFKDAYDYYEQSSSLQYLPNIKTPTLLINALNDSFLSADCYPVKEAKNNENLFLEMPQHGGHVGFIDKGKFYYNEKRALDFIQQSR
ncbi:alpha/beta fold hydrolase [Oceanihabitans sediminis]|uniref:YheT family hydrolase n=1 Tax=Oceanihabitans sediminis TaxID=1812012 RepID=UPI0009319EAF|nr:alpha/beta fold hydrolase [Oceanihabitans sediminis]MDX1277942.1 alpha/beta fold hydrolase [Oceanihabitans sediminis]MDX1773374.1 alpha/beta fold hydrolase [Oceanihabitans sediminis]